MTNERINLQLNAIANETQSVTVEIFDTTGKKIRSQTAATPLYAPDSPGVYFVKLTTPAFTRTIKLSVN
jgi:hypothetical protein